MGSNNKKVRTLAERFWEKVNQDGPVHPVLGTRCWLWTATRDAWGYGQIGLGARGLGVMLML